jgi:Domain of Unknown Function with PDB structure (DUF3857)/Transglutaminase-like superfamily
MKIVRWAAVLLLYSILLAAPSLAFDWPPLSPQDLAMTSIKEQPGAPAVVFLHEETDDDMNNVHTVYMRIKILTDAGREYANIEIPYNRRNFKITEISGRTVHPDGSVVQFSGKPLDKTVLRSSGFRVNVKSFTLPDVQVGSVVDYRYSLRYDDNKVLAPEWEVQGDLFQRKAYFKFIPFQNHGSVDVLLAHNQIARGVAWAPFLGDGPQPQLHTIPTPTLYNGHEVTMWVDLTRENIPALVDEPYMPAASMMKLRVYFYYQQARNLDEYWTAEHKFWDKDASSFIDKNKGVAEALGQIISPADTSEQKVRKIYAFVTTLENQDYIPERTDQENKVLELKPNQGAEDVLAHRSGTHDDLNRLFVSLVRSAGIPASLIWVPDRSHEIFVKQYMSTDQLDAEIAIVQLDGKDVFLDPGSKFCPYGILDWRYTAVGGLRQGATEFGETTPPDYRQSISMRLARVSLDEHGMVDGTVNLSFQGIAAMLRRQEGNRTDAEGRKKMLEDELRAILPGDAEITLSNSPDWESTEEPLIAQFHIRCPYAVAAGKSLMVMQHLFQANEKPRFPATQRNNPVYFQFPWQEADEVHIKLPAGMEVESLAPDDSAKLEYALYQVHQKQEAPDEIFSRRDFIMGGMVVTADKYKDLKNFFDKVASDDEQPALVRSTPSGATAK